MLPPSCVGWTGLSPIMVEGRPVRRARGARLPDMLPVMPAETNMNDIEVPVRRSGAPAPSDPCA